jgi:hypothetical protein
MELSEFYPTPKHLVQSELAILNHLSTDRYMAEEHDRFAQDARLTYQSGRSSSDKGLQFISYFDVWHPGMHKRSIARTSGMARDPNARLIVGTRIHLNTGMFVNVTYCLVVCRLRGGKCTIRRKFHFDLALSSGGAGRREQPHPRCHLQYCGEMVPQMTEMGCRETQLDQMHPWLSEPRIFFWPMSLGLLIDMALSEFAQQHSARFRATPEWRGLVRKQEDLVLRPFYEKCVRIIANNDKKGRTLVEEFAVG